MKYPFVSSLVSAAIFFTNMSFSQGLPIKPARTISFTTDEGSYMNVDVSPDGKTLAFDLLGNLFTVPIEGGNATQITDGISLHLRPVWSPDSKRIAYITDSSGAFHLAVMDWKGPLHRLLGISGPQIRYGFDPVWSSDGNYITIWDSIYGLVHGEIANIADFKNPLRFSESKHLIYFLDSNKIFQCDLLTKSKMAISSQLKRHRSAALSPDARWWCYIDDSNSIYRLILQDLSNNVRQVLLSTLSRIDTRYNPGTEAPHISFSSDSKYLFIGYGGKIHRIDLESKTDQVIPFIAKVHSDLGPYNYNIYRISQAPFKVKYIRSASLSPDNKHLVFCELGKIYVMNLQEGQPRLLVDQPINQYQPSYSPDGKWITYVSWCDTSGGYLWRIPATGGHPERLTSDAGQYQHPEWSPNGKTIAVVKGAPKLGDRDDPGIGRLELIPTNIGKAIILADSVPLWNNLAFSADGGRIIYTPKFTRDVDLSAQIISTNLTGEDRQTLAVGDYFTYFKQKTISQDGKYIVYSADEDLYLLPTCNLTSPFRISSSDQQLSLIRFAPGVDPYWASNGKLSWCYGNKFYQINPTKIILAAEKKAASEAYDHFQENDFITVNVKPDLEVPVNVSKSSLSAHGLLAFKDVRIITMDGGKIIENGTILMKDGRFTALGPAHTIQIPSNAKVLDLAGTTVIPGLIDVHLHMRIPPDIFPQQSWMFLVNLAYGITTARDPSLNFDSFGYAELLQAGEMRGPRLFTVGRAARIDDGMSRCDNLEDARRLVEKRALYDGKVIKQYDLPTRLQREWLQLAANAQGLNITNEGGSDPIQQFAMIKDGSAGVEHNPAYGDIYKDVVSFIVSSHVFITPTLQVCYGTEEGKEYFKYKYWREPDEKLKHFAYSDGKIKLQGNGAESLETIMNAHPKDTINPGFLTPARIDARILHSGGRICLGSHGNDEGIGPHNELWALQMGGMTNMEALQCATIRGAEALGVQQDLGSIEVGKIADLIVLNKNPLDDIHNSREIRYVMKDGILYDGNTLDEIWPEQKKCPDWRLHGTHK